MTDRLAVPLRRSSMPSINAASPCFLQRQCSCGGNAGAEGKCDECAKKDMMLGRQSNGADASSFSPSAVREVLRSGGRPLEKNVRAAMEPRFGHDFSRVQVHTDAGASESARSVNALAYAVDEHIVFQSGHYDPSSGSGRRLLAHELTHVVQNRRSGPAEHRTAAGVSRPGDPAEREAAAVTQQVMGGESAQVSERSQAAVHRVDAGDVGKAIGIGAAIAGGGALLGLGIAALAGAFKSKQDSACPGTHSIPDDVNAAIGKAWGESNHGEEVVAEHGGRMVKDKDGKSAIRTGTGGSGSISLPEEQPGDTTTGTFHTHPYSKSEGSTIGVAFSGGDIANFVAGGQGSVKYIGAGSCNFALNTIDQAKRDECKKKDMAQLWNDAFAAASGSFQEKTIAAVRSSIAGCGLCFYQACRPDDRSAIPQTAKLA